MDVAFVPEVRFPTGNATSFLGGNGVIFAPRVNVETAFGAVRLLLDVGLRYRSTGRYPQPHRGERVHRRRRGVWSSSLGQRLPPARAHRSRPPSPRPLSQPFAGNVGSTSASATTPWEFLVGARTRFGKHWGGEMAVGRGIAEPDAGYGREAFRMLASVRYDFEPEPSAPRR